MVVLVPFFLGGKVVEEKGGGFGVVCADNGVLLVWVLALDDGGCWVGEAGGGGAGKVKVETFLT